MSTQQMRRVRRETAKKVKNIFFSVLVMLKHEMIGKRILDGNLVGLSFLFCKKQIRKLSLREKKEECSSSKSFSSKVGFYFRSFFSLYNKCDLCKFECVSLILPSQSLSWTWFWIEKKNLENPENGKWKRFKNGFFILLYFFLLEIWIRVS